MQITAQYITTKFMDEDFSTQKISTELVAQIIKAIKDKAYGSVEIYIENFKVTQISERTITKLRKSQPIQKINRFQLKVQKFR